MRLHDFFKNIMYFAPNKIKNWSQALLLITMSHISIGQSNLMHYQHFLTDMFVDFPDNKMSHNFDSHHSNSSIIKSKTKQHIY